MPRIVHASDQRADDGVEMVVNIQGLRAVAVILVVLVHSGQQTSHVGSGSFHLELGASGVDLFFVISGFVMCLITEKPLSTSEFLAKRVLRVAPTYLLVTALMAAIVLYAPTVFRNSAFSPLHVIASMLFLPFPHPVQGDAVPLYQPGWTLNYEFLFYVTFSLFLSCSMKKRILYTSVALAVLSCARFTPVSSWGAVGEFYTDSIVLEFGFGMLVYYAYRFSPPLGVRVSTCLLVAAPIVLLLLQALIPTGRSAETRFLIWGVPALLAVTGATGLERRGWRLKWAPLIYVGDASYAIYLTHLFAIGVVALLWKRVDGAIYGSDAVLVFTCIAASVVVGIGFFIGVERPLIAFLRRKSGPATQRGIRHAGS